MLTGLVFLARHPRDERLLLRGWNTRCDLVEMSISVDWLLKGAWNVFGFLFHPMRLCGEIQRRIAWISLGFLGKRVSGATIGVPSALRGLSCRGPDGVGT